MPAGRSLAPAARRPGRGVALLLAMTVLLALAGCQAKVAVTAKVERDGSGTVAVGIGLDDRALTHLGSFDADVRLADLAAAGWTVVPAQKEADGLTWLRATKPFANPTELTAVLAEVNDQGLFTGFTFTRTEDGDTTYRLTGTIDPTKGVGIAGDPQLAARLNGDPFGGLVQRIEQEEGQPVANMVAIDVTAQVADGAPVTVHPSLKDTAATTIDASLVDPKPPSTILLVLVLVGVVLVLAVAAVQLTRARRRFSSSSPNSPS